jgi:hypothetical protein
MQTVKVQTNLGVNFQITVNPEQLEAVLAEYDIPVPPEVMSQLSLSSKYRVELKVPKRFVALYVELIKLQLESDDWVKVVKEE